jgi:hypothetical protein
MYFRHQNSKARMQRRRDANILHSIAHSKFSGLSRLKVIVNQLTADNVAITTVGIIRATIAALSDTKKSLHLDNLPLRFTKPEAA